MNQAHLDILSSEEWAETQRTEISHGCSRRAKRRTPLSIWARARSVLCVSPILVLPTEQSACLRGVEETLLFAQQMAPGHGWVMPF